MVTKECGKDFGFEQTENSHDALTLDPSDLGVNESGWEIKGEVIEDWYEWVNAFEATHPDFGRVWGDFESFVYADSEQGFKHFYENHPPTSWDYWDI